MDKKSKTYFQFSLNDYDKEKYEAKVPSVESRIKTFKELSQKLGKKRVVWRYDPLILTKDIDVNELLRRVKNIGNQIHEFTEKLVFSFADIDIYTKWNRDFSYRKRGNKTYSKYIFKGNMINE